MSKMKAYLDNEGIMRVEYPPYTILTLNDVQEEYKKRLEITIIKKTLLIKIHGVMAFSTKAQKFLCSSEHCTTTNAAAVVCDSKAGYFEYSKMLMHSFKYLYKPPFDFNVFESE